MKAFCSLAEETMDRSLRIGLVNAVIWATIGTFVALEMNAYLWWVGLLVGGIGGYLTYEWRTVVWAIPHAWQRATSWRPNREYWQMVWYIALFVNGLSCTVTGLIFCLLIILEADDSGLIATEGLGIVAFFALIMGFVFPFLSGIIVATKLPRDLTERQDERAWARYMAVRFNFFSFWFWTAPRFCYQLWREDILPALREKVPKIPGAIHSISARSLWLLGKAAVVSGRFCWHLYKLIHTEERWLVSVDIACGVAVGYFLGSAVIGGLAGGAFWLADYALVARLWLKTLPGRIH